jgi:cytochrome P450
MDITHTADSTRTLDISHTLPEPRAFPAGLREPAGRTADSDLPRASILDTMSLLLDVVLPTIAKGVIIRRRTVLAMAEWLDLDRRAIRRVQRLRSRYGTRPLILRMPDRPRALILDPDDVHRVLEETPEPFSPASTEKRAALSHFEPRNSLITPPGPQRTVRRRLNEQTLQSGSAVHAFGQRFAAVIEDEIGQLLASSQREGQLSWDDFEPAWFAVVRRVCFGDAAREDHEISRLMAQLRHNANWAFLWPRRTDLLGALLGRIRYYMERREPGSLVAMMADIPPPPGSEPENQVPQWLFAADPAGMATFRALALLAVHPELAEAAREEAHRGDALLKPMLRASVLESLRLWPTTPLVLRETTREINWGGGVLKAGTGVVIFAPFFHRDAERLAFADRFEPQLWLAERTTKDWPLIPFSSGPAVCPARHLVLLLTSTVLSELLQGARFQLERPTRMNASRPLPATLSHFGLRFGVSRR